MGWFTVILVSAGLVVLAAIAASGLGPVSSLVRTVKRLSDLGDELDDLRRSLDRLKSRLEARDRK